jgi:hypothetical protein
MRRLLTIAACVLSASTGATLTKATVVAQTEALSSTLFLQYIVFSFEM